jgi:tetratricopeptide (TPR) repeat protein
VSAIRLVATLFADSDRGALLSYLRRIIAPTPVSGAAASRMKTSADESRTEAVVAAIDSAPAPHAPFESDRARESFDAHVSTLQAYLEHTPRLDPESRAEFCAEAHRIALATLELASDDEKRSYILKLWAELCIWESEGLAEPDRSQRLQQAVAKLEQATLLDSSNIGAHKTLARAITKLADRDDRFRAAYSAFERASLSAPNDWRVWHDWAQTLTEHATRVDSNRARALLTEAARLLERGSDTVEEPQARARLIDDRGLTLRALAQRSSPPDRLAHLEQSQLEFQRATEREPSLELAWSHWAELLLEQARVAGGEQRDELQNRALEVLSQAIRAIGDPDAASRLSIQRSQALLWIGLHGAAEDCSGRLEEASQELARALEIDPGNVRALQLSAELCTVRARLVEPKRARELLRSALDLNERALEVAVQQSPAIETRDAQRARLHCQRGAIWELLGEQSRGRSRKLAFEQAVEEFERAPGVAPKDAETLRATASFLCAQARHAEPSRARELVERASELLFEVAEKASDENTAAELHHAYGLTALAQMQLASGIGRDLALANATIAFQDACSAQRTFVAAWRSWSRLCSDCARRDVSLESALEQFQEADDVLDAAMQSVPLGPGTAELLTERAGIFLAQAKRVRSSERRQCYERAIACLEEATQIEPALAQAWQCWGLALAERGHYDATVDSAECFRSAIERYQRAADVLPLDLRHRVWIELGRELAGFARLDPDGASALVKDVADRLGVAMREIPSQSAEYCLARGNLLRDAGRLAAAELDYARGRETGVPVRESLACHYQLSSVLEDRGLARREHARLRRAYERYVHTHAPRLDPEVLGTYGRLLYEQGGPSELAESQLAAAIALRPRGQYRLEMLQVELARERARVDPRTLAALGVRLEAAREEIESSDFEPALRELQLGKLALYRSDHARARQHLETALSLDRWSAPACELLGLLALEHGQYEEACELLSTAHVLAPHELEILPLMATTLTRLGEFTDAELMFQRAVASAPFDARAMLAWADACLSRTSSSSHPELLARAHEYASMAITLARKHKSRRLRANQLAQAHYTRGYAAIRLCERAPDLDRWEQAKADFRAALRIDPQYHEARRALARLAANGASRRLTLQRAASSLIGALAFGVFAIAQLGFWPRVQPVIQLCAGDVCSGPLSLRALNVTGYATLTFGALAFIALAVALPHWLRPKPASIPLERKPIEPEATRAVAP